MAEWDDKNRPKYWIPGVSPGFSSYMQGDEKMNYQGFARKLMKAARFGFEFAMLDYEAMSEMFEPDIDKKLEIVRRNEGIEFGLHLPVDLDPSVVFATEWRAMHDMFVRGAYAGKFLKARFIHTHSSNTIEPALTFNMGGMERPGKLAGFDGTNLGAFLIQADEKTFKDDWFAYFKKPQKYPEISMAGWFKAKYIKLLFQGIVVSPELIVGLYEFETYEDAMREYSRILKEALNRIKEEKTAEWSKKKEDAEKRFDAMKQTIEKYNEYDQLTKQAEELAKQIQSADEKQKALIQRKIREITEKAEGLKDEITALMKKANTSESTIQQDMRATEMEINEMSARLEKIKPLEIPDGEEGLKKYGELMTSKEVSDLIPGFVHEMSEKMEEIIRGESEKFAYPPQNYPSFIAEIAMHMSRYSIKAWFKKWVDDGSEATEAVAYRAVAKYMYLTRDPLWIEMVEKPYRESGEFSGGIDPDVVIDFENKIEAMKKVWKNRYGKGALIDFLNKADRRRLLQRIVAAVNAKYIQGHLFVRKNGRRMGAMTFLIGDNGIDKEERDMSVYEYCARNKLRIYFENGFSRDQQFHPEGRLRMMHMEDHCRMIHTLDRGEWTGYCPDYEHIVVNLINPEKDAEMIPDGYAKYITEMHINAPRPLNATHAPIELLSTDTEELYRWLYKLWKKGQKASYIIWEMGSYGVRQSALVFRKFKQELDKPLKGLGEPTPPEKLPPEFFGIDEKFEATTKIAIIEHAFDPLEGVLLVPEEKHTFLGGAAKEKQKLGEWATEELW